MDGVACAYAYAELLQTLGTDAFAAVFETPLQEAQFVLDHFLVQMPRAEDAVREAVILVDTSSIEDISSTISPDEVIEIIDHRVLHDAPLFKNATAQIELVGAAATLVAERFFELDRIPSQTSAALLLCAIYSNTINFRSKNTTQRDHAAKDRLWEIAQLPEGFIHEMFECKSSIADVEAAVDEDLVLKQDGGKKIGLGQLEIVRAEEFVRDRKPEIISALQSLVHRERLDAMLLGVVDIEQELSAFIVADEASRELFSRILGMTFHDDVAVHPTTLLRKEISPILKAALETERV
jgi:manganese-dependent inorganic pyrophosphatase